MSAPADAADDVPDLDVRVVRGAPTDDELAAVLAVLHAAASRPRPHTPAPRSVQDGWQQSRRDLRAPLRPGLWP